MQTYGPITIDSWNQYHKAGQYLHVFLDGIDITTSCFFADDVDGIVRVYLRNAEGRMEVDPATLKARWAQWTGKVQIIAESIKSDRPSNE